MIQPKISFVCPSYNHAKYIDSFISSLLQQTISDWELIIVDDCSSDGNVTAIKQFSDPRITLIENPFNKGINFGFGAAIERASSGIICLIASDDILLPEYSETVYRHPQIPYSGQTPVGCTAGESWPTVRYKAR